MPLKLKSKIIQAYDPDQIDIHAYAIRLKEDPLLTQIEVKKFCRAFAQKIKVEDLQNEDMATLCMVSQNPKFNKEKITLRIGLGLYSKELETKLVGLKVNETATIYVDHDKILVTPLESIREMIPEANDELAARCQIEGIQTKDDIITACRYKQYDDILEEALDEASTYYAGEWMKQTTFALDDAELDIAIKNAKATIHSDALEAEVDGDGDALAKQIGQSTLQAAVLGQELVSLGQEDYDAYIQKRAVAFDLSIEEAKAKEPLIQYLIYSYSDAFIEQNQQKISKQLKALGEAKEEQHDRACNL